MRSMALCLTSVLCAMRAFPAAAEGLILSQSSGQMTSWFNDQPYHYNNRDLRLLHEALKPVKEHDPAAVLVWGRNVWLHHGPQHLFDGLQRALGREWHEPRRPILLGSLFLPAIALTPVEFTPCNDALDFTVFAGDAVRIRAIAVPRPEGAVREQAAAVATQLASEPDDRLLLLLASQEFVAQELLTSFAESFRAAFPQVTIVGVIGGRPMYQLEAYGEGLVAAMISGKLDVNTCHAHPYRALTQAMSVTGCVEGRIAELDGKPVRDVHADAITGNYRALSNSSVLRRFPLGVKTADGWQPVLTFPPNDDGSMATDPSLAQGSEVAVLERDDGRMLSLPEELLKGQARSSREPPAWQLVISNEAFWDGWTESEEDFARLSEAGGKAAVTDLIYPEDAFLAVPGEPLVRGVFSLLALQLREMF